MKRLFTLTVFLLAGLVAFSQYYYVKHASPGQNPGGLNTDGEYPVGGGLPAGWTTVLAANANPLWSTQQSIPFNFDFNGSSVTSYYVSNSGVLTFNSTPGTAPGFTPSALPNSSLPDETVCVWGIMGVTAGSDNVVSKTFGSAPNRQHWILFSSFELGSNSYCYWSIMLEETTNKIYIVDQRQYQVSGSIYGGIQIDNTSAIAINGFAPEAGSDPTPADNVYYEFIPGTQPDYDAVLNEVTVNGSTDKPVIVNNNNTVGGTISNLGAQSITSFDVVYKVDGAGAQTYSVNGVNVVSGGSYTFTHGTPWNPTSGGGLFSTLSVEITNLNGGQTDANPSDNTMDVDFFLNNGVTTTKYVLFEEYSTAPCGFCPDGLLVIEDMLATLNNVNFAQIHAGFGTDAMTIPEHTQWAAAFTNAAPTAQVDRVHYEGEDYVAFSRSLWKQRAQSRLNEGVPVNIIMEGDYNESTRQLSLDVKAEFKDYAVPGDYRLNVYLTEDPVVGTGSGYDQINYYSSQHSSGGVGGASHPYYNEPNPIVGYEHRFVIRAVPSTTWGTSGVIPQAPQPNQTYEKSYTVTLDQSWDEPEIHVIAFVSRYDNDPKKRPVMNSYQEHLDAFKNIGINGPKVEAEIEVYPNPASDFAQVSLDLEKTSDVTIEVVNAVGQRHTAFAHSATFAAGKQYVTLPTYEWGAGVYLVNIRINGVNMVKQLVVTR